MIKVYECWSLIDENGNTQKDLTLELWGGSTKHPDSKFYFSDFKKSPFVDEEHQIFQWLLECASKLTFPFHAKELCEYALKNYVTWEKPRETQAFILAGRPWAKTPVFRIIPPGRNFVKEKDQKSCTNIFPKICAFCLLYFLLECSILIIVKGRCVGQ